MDRRRFLGMLALAGGPGLRAAEVSIRGTLSARGGKPVLDSPQRGVVFLTGDKATVGVLTDKRLAESDFEALGQFKTQTLFEIGPIHTRSMFVHRGGKRLYITYWCDLCSIRTYTPGICWCCQQDTALDLREKDDS